MSPCGCAPRAAIASRAALRCRTGRQRARWPSPRRSASLSRTPVLSVRKKLPCQLLERQREPGGAARRLPLVAHTFSDCFVFACAVPGELSRLSVAAGQARAAAKTDTG